jgi:protein O-mannosyl-transferase
MGKMARLMDRSKNTWRTLLVGSLLAAATLAAFWPVSQNAFINYDDPLYVTRNPHLTGGWTWANVTWAFRTGYASNWHPVTWLSHLLDVQLFGLNASAHHLTSLLLHVANTLLLFLVLQRMTGALWRCAFVAALFALHPLHVESVAWVAERKDVLSTFFFMLTLWAYARYAQKSVISNQYSVVSSQASGESAADHKPRTTGHPSSVAESVLRSRTAEGGRTTGYRSLITDHRLRYYLLALLFFALGLMSKPMLVTLPFVLLLLDYWPLQRFRPAPSTLRTSARKFQLSSFILHPLFLEKLPFLALSALSCGVTLLAQTKGEAVASFEMLPFGRRMAHAIAAYLDYLQQTFWPSHLAVFYPLPAEMSAARTIGAAALLAAITAAALFLARRRPWAPVGWFWYLGVLVPVIGLVQVGEQARADRYTYLPLIGIFILVAWGVEALVGIPSPEDGRAPVVRPGSARLRSGLLAAGAGVVLVGLALTTHRQVGFWRDSRTLFEHAVQLATNNYVAWQCLGIVDMERNDPEAALAKFTRANVCRRASATNYENLYFIGTALQAQGKGLEALPYLEQSVVSVEQRPYRDYRLGLSLIAADRLAEAEAALRRAIEAMPQVAEFQLGMAALLETQGQAVKAEQLLREMVNRHPKLPQARRSLADFLMLHDRPAEAEVQYVAAVKLQRPDAKVLRAYAAALSKQGKNAEAIRQLEAALNLEPKHAQTNFELAELLSQQGRNREAIARYSQALEADPKNLSALNNLAWLLATHPDPEIRNGPRAVGLAERACQLTEWKTAFLMGTLAAAYAEAGRFADAVATAERARDRARADNLEDVAKTNERLLELYRGGQPFRDTGGTEKAEP